MSGAIPPLLNTPSWRGAQFKNSTGATLPLPFNRSSVYELFKAQYSKCDIVTATKTSVRRISGLEGGEVKLENVSHEEFPNLYSSTNIISVIKSRRLRWAGRIVPVKF